MCHEDVRLLREVDCEILYRLGRETKHSLISAKHMILEPDARPRSEVDCV